MFALLDELNAPLVKSTVVSTVYVAAIYCSNFYLKQIYFKKKLKEYHIQKANKKTKIQNEKKQEVQIGEDEEEDDEEEEEEINKLKRDDPVVIKSRMIFVCSSIFLLLAVFYFNINTVCQLIGVEYRQYDQTTQSVIIKKASLIRYFNQTFQVVLLYCVLYSSQIIDNFLFEKYELFNNNISLNKQQRNYLNFRKLVFDMIGSSRLDIWSLRNYIFAPVTEEIVFTAMILYNYQNINSWKLSLFFGIPHLHHAFELYADIDNSHYTVMTILLTCGFQFLYTFVFGHINNIFYLKNNQNLLCCIVSHSICNYMGFPNIAPLFDITSVSKSNDKQQQLERLNKIYKYFYWSLMLFGLIQYIKYLAA